MDDFHEGWVPATYLEPLYGEADNSVEVFDAGEGKSFPEVKLTDALHRHDVTSPNPEELFLTTAPYTPQHDDEIQFEKGVVVEVFEKGLDGWWKIR